MGDGRFALRDVLQGVHATAQAWSRPQLDLRVPRLIACRKGRVQIVAAINSQSIVHATLRGPEPLVESPLVIVSA
jgi:hypothetical protein